MVWRQKGHEGQREQPTGSCKPTAHSLALWLLPRSPRVCCMCPVLCRGQSFFPEGLSRDARAFGADSWGGGDAGVNSAVPQAEKGKGQCSQGPLAAMSGCIFFNLWGFFCNSVFMTLSVIKDVKEVYCKNSKTKCKPVTIRYKTGPKK